MDLESGTFRERPTPSQSLMWGLGFFICETTFPITEDKNNG